MTCLRHLSSMRSFHFPVSLRCSEELADKIDTLVSILLSVTTELQRHNNSFFCSAVSRLASGNIHNHFIKIKCCFYFFIYFLSFSSKLPDPQLAYLPISRLLSSNICRIPSRWRRLLRHHLSATPSCL